MDDTGDKLTTIEEHVEGHVPVLYEPRRHRTKVAALDYGIKEAKRIKEWPILEEAVDAKIDEQRQFYTWWQGTVRSQGEARKKESRERGVLSMPDAEDLTGMANQRVSDLGKLLKDPAKYRDKLLGAEYRAAMLMAVDNVRGTQGTGENEWFTPPEFIARARNVLGGIDLDPATHPVAQETVQAEHYFTEADNGLEQPWHGRVWLNPPYAQPAIANFVDKMVKEVIAGRVSAAVMLTHNYTDTAWFHQAAGRANAICFTRGRIKFVDVEGSPCAPTQGQAFFYFGEDIAAFTEQFKPVGFVVRPA